MKIRVRSLLVASIFAIIASFVMARSARAQYGQYGQYGTPSTSSAVMVDKLVSRNPIPAGTDPRNVEYVDNLSASDRHFAPGDQIAFLLKVKNVSDSLLSNVKLEDMVPSYINPLGGVGGFNSTTRIVSIQVGDLGKGEERDYIVPMQVVSADQLTNNQGVFCVINKAQASTDKVADEDSAQFCIEKPALSPTPTPTGTLTPTPTPTPAPNVSVVPRTGPEFGPLLIGLETIAMAAGIYLKRKSS